MIKSYWWNIFRHFVRRSPLE